MSGKTTFMGVSLAVAPGVLVPREETELLGYAALSILDGVTPGPARVIDMCCGSGNLACALATLRPSARVWASDLTDGAIAVARMNVAQLGLGDRVTIVQGDLFAPLQALGLEGTIDLVVCNPPYISSGKLAKESADLLRNEPREAFDGGPYGVSIFQRVIKDAAGFLKPGGHLGFEIGAGQDRQVGMLFSRSPMFEAIRQEQNSNGVTRVVIGRRTAVQP